MKATERLKPGDRIEIVRKSEVRHRGVVIDHRVTDDGDAWSSEVEILRVQIDDLGVRSLRRTVSERGVLGDWHAKAKDLQRIGAFRVRRELGPIAIDLDVVEEDSVHGFDDVGVEEDAARDMGGDDFVEYEAATGKQIGNK